MKRINKAKRRHLIECAERMRKPRHLVGTNTRVYVGGVEVPALRFMVVAPRGAA